MHRTLCNRRVASVEAGLGQFKIIFQMCNKCLPVEFSSKLLRWGTQSHRVQVCGGIFGPRRDQSKRISIAADKRNLHSERGVPTQVG